MRGQVLVENDYMTTKVQEKFKKARYFLSKARRELDSREDLVRPCRAINAALNRGMEAWLITHKLWNDYLNDRNMMQSEFSRHAPRILRCKVFTTYHKVYKHSTEEAVHLIPDSVHPEALEKWLQKIYACLSDADHIIHSIEHKVPEEIAFPGVSPPEYHAGQWLIHTYRDNSQDLTCLGKVLVAEKHSVTVRYTHRRIAVLDADCASLRPAGRPDDNMHTPFERRRTWFDLHPECRQVPLHFSSRSKNSLPCYFTCPCCGYPSLTLQQASCDYDGSCCYEICSICEWGDEYDQDDHDSDEIKGGANWDYSLSEARRNFAQYGWMFRLNETSDLIRLTKQSILNIRDEIRAKYDAMIGKNNSEKLSLLQCENKRLWKSLDIELKKREKSYHRAFEKMGFDGSEKEQRVVSYTPHENH